MEDNLLGRPVRTVATAHLNDGERLTLSRVGSFLDTDGYYLLVHYPARGAAVELGRYAVESAGQRAFAAKYDLLLNSAAGRK